MRLTAFCTKLPASRSFCIGGEIWPPKCMSQLFCQRKPELSLKIRQREIMYCNAKKRATARKNDQRKSVPPLKAHWNFVAMRFPGTCQASFYCILQVCLQIYHQTHSYDREPAVQTCCMEAGSTTMQIRSRSLMSGKDRSRDRRPLMCSRKRLFSVTSTLKQGTGKSETKIWNQTSW